MSAFQGANINVLGKVSKPVDESHAEELISSRYKTAVRSMENSRHADEEVTTLVIGSDVLYNSHCSSHILTPAEAVCPDDLSDFDSEEISDDDEDLDDRNGREQVDLCDSAWLFAAPRPGSGGDPKAHSWKIEAGGAAAQDEPSPTKIRKTVSFSLETEVIDVIESIKLEDQPWYHFMSAIVDGGVEFVEYRDPIFAFEGAASWLYGEAATLEVDLADSCAWFYKGGSAWYFLAESFAWLHSMEQEVDLADSLSWLLYSEEDVNDEVTLEGAEWLWVEEAKEVEGDNEEVALNGTVASWDGENLVIDLDESWAGGKMAISREPGASYLWKIEIGGVVMEAEVQFCTEEEDGEVNLNDSASWLFNEEINLVDSPWFFLKPSTVEDVDLASCSWLFSEGVASELEGDDEDWVMVEKEDVEAISEAGWKWAKVTPEKRPGQESGWYWRKVKPIVSINLSESFWIWEGGDDEERPAQPEFDLAESAGWLFGRHGVVEDVTLEHTGWMWGTERSVEADEDDKDQEFLRARTGSIPCWTGDVLMVLLDDSSTGAAITLPGMELVWREIGAGPGGTSQEAVMLFYRQEAEDVWLEGAEWLYVQ